MNDLSWLLYAADVLPSLKGWMNVASWCLIIPCILGWFIVTCMIMSEGLDDELRAFRNGLWNGTKTALPFLFVCLTISTIIPSRDTIYLIAASEMGEEALKTEQAQKVGDYLDSLLDNLADRAQGEG
jgi:hypothetical protein